MHYYYFHYLKSHFLYLTSLSYHSMKERKEGRRESSRQKLLLIPREHSSFSSDVFNSENQNILSPNFKDMQNSSIARENKCESVAIFSPSTCSSSFKLPSQTLVPSLDCPFFVPQAVKYGFQNGKSFVRTEWNVFSGSNSGAFDAVKRHSDAVSDNIATEKEYVETAKVAGYAGIPVGLCGLESAVIGKGDSNVGDDNCDGGDDDCDGGDGGDGVSFHSNREHQTNIDNGNNDNNGDDDGDNICETSTPNISHGKYDQFQNNDDDYNNNDDELNGSEVLNSIKYDQINPTQQNMKKSIIKKERIIDVNYYGNLKFVALKVKNAKPRPLDEKEYATSSYKNIGNDIKNENDSDDAEDEEREEGMKEEKLIVRGKMRNKKEIKGKKNTAKNVEDNKIDSEVEKEVAISTNVPSHDDKKKKRTTSVPSSREENNDNKENEKIGKISENKKKIKNNKNDEISARLQNEKSNEIVTTVKDEKKNNLKAASKKPVDKSKKEKNIVVNKISEELISIEIPVNYENEISVDGDCDDVQAPSANSESKNVDQEDNENKENNNSTNGIIFAEENKNKPTKVKTNNNRKKSEILSDEKESSPIKNIPDNIPIQNVRTATPYALYCRARKEEMKISHPDYSASDLLKIITLKWKNLNSEEKEIWHEKSAKSGLISKNERELLNEKNRIVVWKTAEEDAESNTKKLENANNGENFEESACAVEEKRNKSKKLKSTKISDKNKIEKMKISNNEEVNTNKSTKENDDDDKSDNDDNDNEDFFGIQKGKKSVGKGKKVNEKISNENKRKSANDAKISDVNKKPKRLVFILEF